MQLSAASPPFWRCLWPVPWKMLPLVPRGSQCIACFSVLLGVLHCLYAVECSAGLCSFILRLADSQCFNESGPLTVEVIDAALPVILS